MKRITTLLTACILFINGFSQNSLKPIDESTETEYFPGEVLVQLRTGYKMENVLSSFPQNLQLKSLKELSPLMRIWHLSFDSEQISNTEMLKELLKHPGIRIAQNNHVVEERATMPNDPNTAANQWHHNNTGQTGGTNDVDIDSDLAWDITTGGLTVQGDTIVVCIVEGPGAYYNHPDLIGNFWRNYDEIPNNGIDDDNNGYIDDFDGWRVDNNNDNHAAGGHGTQCMGMIGAKGNNSVGVVGANWDVKMMLVSGFSVSESSVIAAYNYPMKMRKMYNESNGTEGAFVVATSASWGIDNADPNNYPLWCAVYDSLGKYGILNPGATTNNTVDVDVNGDMPTACPSDYMISVTRTSETDAQAGGYGLTTVDFGAPGIDVYTTSGTNSGNSSYGNTTGTSFSCPLTAGVIGLIYSIPCNSFIALAKADPQAAADQVRLALMNGTDPTTAMNGKSVTGGRLNAFNSINEILNTCSASGCITPYGLSASGVTDTDATLSWNSGSANDYIFYIQESGSSIWDTATVSGTSLFIDTLTGCTEYIFMVQAICPPSDTSGISPTFSFFTDGCCVAPENVSVNVTSNSSATVSFNSVLAASSYNVNYRPVSSSTWSTVNSSTIPVTISGLDSCTVYEVQVQTICGIDSTSYTPIETFATTGCGLCESSAYCSAGGNNSVNDWIANVSLNSINRTSLSDGGYIFTGNMTDLYSGQTYPISLTPGYSGSANDEHFVVWIDYNGNQLFEAIEIVHNSGAVNFVSTGNVTVPSGVMEGSTRMRVAMKYVGGGSTAQPSACGNFTEGEVEDYCVNLIDTVTVGIHENEPIVIYQVYPNPANDNITFDIINFKSFIGKNELIITNSLGENVHQQKLTNGLTVLSVDEFANGIYHYSIDLNGTKRNGKFVVQK